MHREEAALILGRPILGDCTTNMLGFYFRLAQVQGPGAVEKTRLNRSAAPIRLFSIDAVTKIDSRAECDV